MVLVLLLLCFKSWGKKYLDSADFFKCIFRNYDSRAGVYDLYSSFLSSFKMKLNCCLDTFPLTNF